MINLKKTGGKVILTMILVLLTLSTSACGKKSNTKKGSVEKQASGIEKFCTDFFTDCNLPYEKLQIDDVQNTPDEYLFYIENGLVYRTTNDCTVVIVERSNIRESEEQAGSNYSGELYNVFDGDDVDMLKYSACGNYAIMASLSTISNWQEDEIITSFMKYAEDYSG